MVSLSKDESLFRFYIFTDMNKRRAKTLFIVQAGGRNVFDQRWLEYELLER